MSLKTLLPTMLVLTASTALSASQNHQVYDGSWWHSAARDQRIGWLAGYTDCTIRHGNITLVNVSWHNLEPEVTKFYESHPNEAALNVPAVVSKVVGTPAVPRDKGGEKGSGLDGEYWRQVPDQREGFVQGFLASYQELKTKKATFSKSASWYASQISKWYGVKEDDPAEINEKRVSVAIADVLLKFKDAPDVRIQSGRGTAGEQLEEIAW